MGWILVVLCIPLMPLLFVEMALPAIRRARERHAPRPRASTEGPYRDSPVPLEIEPKSYSAAWARYRRLRLTMFVLLLSLVPAFAVLTPLLVRVTGFAGAGYVLAFGWFVSCAIYNVRWAFFRCPRCHHYLRSPFLNIGRFNLTAAFARECQQCGLAMYAPCDPGPPR